jgi:CRISPR-associated protein Cmr5
MSKSSASLRSMDQERAEFALKKIQSVVGGPDEEHKKEVRRYLNNLPALIRMNGLGQALAFCLTKKKKKPDDKDTAHETIYYMVSAWLCDASSKGRIFNESTDVISAITQSDMAHYMAAQNEALALLQWLKKFAVALLPAKED